MICQKVRYPSANGQHEISAAFWLPDHKKPKALVQISHGMCEHMGRYRAFGAYLTGLGFAVAIQDHAGHGESLGKKGCFGPGNGGDTLVRDMHTLFLRGWNQYGIQPCFLLGHSMGSFLARSYVVRYPQDFQGLILCGTGEGNPITALGIGLCRLCGWIWQRDTPALIVTGASSVLFNRRISDHRTPMDWLSSDPEQVDSFLGDSRCRFSFSWGAYEALLQVIQSVSGRKWVGRLPEGLPVLLMGGREDPVGRYGASVERLHGWFQEDHPDVTCLIYDHCRHEVLNERIRKRVWQDVAEWLEEKKELVLQRL